jgi:membrane protease YdiL (CAAX protease family)
MSSTKQGADHAAQSSVDARAKRPLPIAPFWHSAALILAIVAVSLVGTLLAQSGRAPSPPPAAGKLAVYLPMMVVPWLLTFSVTRVGRAARARRSLAALVGKKWDTAPRAAVDLALALGIALAIVACERALATRIDAQRTAALAALLPTTIAERFAWLLVAISVGFGEEVVYRGYLRAQLGALTKSPWIGVAGQALLFGIAHLDQGPAAAGRIALSGLLLGALVRARQSLLPAIAAHIAIDAASLWA